MINSKTNIGIDKQPKANRNINSKIIGSKFFSVKNLKKIQSPIKHEINSPSKLISEILERNHIPQYNISIYSPLSSRTISSQNTQLSNSKYTHKKCNSSYCKSLLYNKKKKDNNDFTNKEVMIDSTAKEFSNFDNYNHLLKRKLQKNKISKVTVINNNEKKKTSNSEFSKIHEKLTRRISEVRASDSNPEIIFSLCENYLLTLGEISRQMDPEVSSLINAICSGLSNSIEIFFNKIKKCQCLILEKENLALKENNKSLLILNQNCSQEVQSLQNKNLEFEKLIKQYEEAKKIKNCEKAIQTRLYTQMLLKTDTQNKKANLKEISRLKKRLRMHKQRENKLIYFYNILDEKGYPVQEIYESQIKSISTERFTSKTLTENEVNISKKTLNDISLIEHKKEECDKIGFEPILNISNEEIKENMEASKK